MSPTKLPVKYSEVNGVNLRFVPNAVCNIALVNCVFPHLHFKLPIILLQALQINKCTYHRQHSFLMAHTHKSLPNLIEEVLREPVTKQKYRVVISSRKITKKGGCLYF